MRVRNLRIATIAAWLLVIGMAACNGGTPADTNADDPTPRQGKLSVYTSCFPVDWLTRQIAGEHADVTLILPAGEDPPDWTPPVEVVSAMQKADLVLINGATFEGWVATTTLPHNKLIDTTAHQKAELIVIEDDGTHSHGKEGEHTHKGTDPHTWSDPKLALAQAAAIRDALATADPTHADAYQANHDALTTRLEGLDAAYRAALSQYDGEVMATSHPAFNYLARQYGLDLRNFGFEPDAQPDDDELARLKETVSAEGITRMLWEAQPTPEVQATFDELGLNSLFIDPLEQPAEGGGYDYLAQANDNVAVLRTLFNGGLGPIPGADQGSGGAEAVPETDQLPAAE